MIDWIETYTGRKCSLTEPTVDMICIEDIAHALSNICRYNGHTEHFYSVAEHSVLLSDWLYSKFRNPQLSFKALMHDAHEAYVHDITLPMRYYLFSSNDRKYEITSSKFKKVVAQYFNFEVPLPAIIYLCDRRILKDERRQLKPQTSNDWGLQRLNPLGININAWLPAKAKHEFYSRYNTLTELISKGW